MTRADVGPAALGEAVEANLAARYAYLGRAAGAEMVDEGDLLWVVTPVASAIQNGVVRARLGHLSPARRRRRVEEVLDRFRRRRVYMSWWTGPATQPSGLSGELRAAGMSFGDPPGLAADLRALREDGAPTAGLEIAPVADEAGLWQWVAAMGAEFDDESRRAHFELYASLGLGADLPWRHYLGRIEGAPVAAASLFLGAGVAGLYNVAVEPRVRRRGIGSAITLAALRAARDEGFDTAVLQSSAAGLPLYRRLGFVECCRMGQHCLRYGAP